MSFMEPANSRVGSMLFIFETTKPVVIDTLAPPAPFVSPGAVEAKTAFLILS
jgi:hypothetical protein